ncbi:MAG: hypothetical protein HY067_10495 [Betaproteobacteria bacterium]|nr:hypothetical protein [Betaproteobacteria bacterium]
MCAVFRVVVFNLVLLLCTPVFAAGDTSRTFEGMNFGVGFSVTHATGSVERVKTAELDSSRIVRVTKDTNDLARVMLELHYFFYPELGGTHSFLGGPEATKWGHGPFMAIQPGSDNIIDAIGFGWMVGFRRSGSTNSSFNVGLGMVIDPSVQVLGDGITKNQPLPAGETTIRYKETSQRGVLLLFSYTFDSF